MKSYNKLAILAVQSLGIVGFVMMSPVLPDVQAEYPGAGSVAVQMLVTLPAVCSLVVGQISGWMSNFAEKRHLILTGLVVFGAGGLGGYVAAEFWQLFVCRVLVGVGMGLFYPVNLSLVSDLFEGRERTAMIGWTMAANYFGGAIGTVAAGFLAASHWRSVFLVNLYVILVLAICVFFLPSHRNNVREAGRRYQLLPWRVYLLAVFAMAQMLVFYSCVTNFASRTQEMGRTQAIAASIGVAALYIGCFLTGMVLVRIQTAMGAWMVPAAVAAMALGFFGLTAADNLLVLYAGIFLVGLGDGVIIPSIMARTAEVCPAVYSGQAMATVNIGTSMGQFASPLFFAGIKMIRHTETAQSGFGGVCILLIAVTAVLVVRTAAGKTRRRQGCRQG